MKRRRIGKIISVAVSFLLLFIGALALFSASWYVKVYGYVGFDSIIFSLLADIGGVEKGLLVQYSLGALLPAVVLSALLTFVICGNTKRKLKIQWGDKKPKTLYPFSRIGSVICSLVLTVALIMSAASVSGADDYVRYLLAPKSTLFEDRYIDPSKTEIVFPDEKRNLIYIYLESMEISFLPQSLGGGNDVNPIPELYSLAQSNINFSQNSGVGGFSSLSGGTWTVAAMVSGSSGIPLKTPLNVDSNDYGTNGFLPGVTSMSDVLHANGYYQALMVGSDATYGGRRQYYEEHGTDKIYDLFTAREDNVIPDDYYVWWGMEDKYLYSYAKDKLTEMSKQDKPFAFTMLTVDSHHIGGYVCDKCGNEFPEQYENVLACSSQQLYQFVEWLREQDFYDNTTIVIAGDHPTMDNDYISRNTPVDFDRKVYNCFINSAAVTDNVKNREFCTYDLFPTVLSAMGCKIKGNRLGLGTDLFSSTPTLCEELGTEEFNAEISKPSAYYTKKFY